MFILFILYIVNNISLILMNTLQYIFVHLSQYYLLAINFYKVLNLNTHGKHKMLKDNSLLENIYIKSC